jgi:DNA polymerase-3 subunit beta
MEITIDRQYLHSKVDIVKGITKHKSLLAVTRSVLIELDGEHGKISATDLETSAISGLKGSNGDESLKIVVPAGTLSDILASIGDQEITLAVRDGENVLKIEQGRVEIGLALMDPEEFPDIEVLNDTEAFQIPAKDILRGIGKVLYAVSVDEKRFILTGVLMQAKGGEFRMCATDGYRLALLKKEIPDIPDSPQIVIPGRNIKLLREILDENATVGVIINEARVQFMTSQATVIFRTLQDAYPAYESILASTGTYNIAFAKRLPFLECLCRMAPLGTKTDWVKLTRTSPGGLTVRMESEKGYAQETIDCEFKSDTEFDFAFNLKYLLDAVEHIDSDQLVIRYPGAYGVVVLDSVDYICGVMPIRTTGDWTPIEQQAKASGGKDE